MPGCKVFKVISILGVPVCRYLAYVKSNIIKGKAREHYLRGKAQYS